MTLCSKIQIFLYGCSPTKVINYFLSLFHTCFSYLNHKMPWKRLFQVCTVIQPLLHHEEPKLTEYVFRVFLICQIATVVVSDYIIADLASDEK